MPVPLRRFYAQKLVDAKKNEAIAKNPIRAFDGDSISSIRAKANSG